VALLGSLAAFVGARIYSAGMAAEVLDGETVRRWCRLSVDALARARAAIDALNVFPVPDADTGTNLHLTLMAADEAVEPLPPAAGPDEVWPALARGALLGACGNSGIIVSQLLRGLADVCAAEPRCDGAVLARALTHAAATARAAVSRPAEGTVLTVADAAARGAARAVGSGGTGGSDGSGGLAAAVTAAVGSAREALAGTREQLDVLAARGVVDAGAAGLCVILDALAAVVTGDRSGAFEVPAPRPAPAAAAGAPAPREPASSGYEVTYLLEASAGPVRELRERLDSLGDSLVIVGGEGLWNVHVHVADAGAAIEEGLRAGRPRRITVTWLGPAAAGRRGLVAVADSDGPASLLRAAGAHVLRQRDAAGPAVPALIETIRQAGAHVAVIPNADRVAGLARAAADRLGDEGIEVSVIPARSALQGIAAVAVHDPGRSFEADVAAMSRAAAGVRYGSVTGPGRRGGFTGRDGEEVTVTGADQGDVAAALAAGLLSRGGELVILMEGAGAEPGLARRVADRIGQASPELEVVCYDGGPVPLLIGVE
jgi:DAK2 domain fusion protein YloV